jgi:predicted nucleotidyltransferase/uncharacterized protein (UPF0332 family)
MAKKKIAKAKKSAVKKKKVTGKKAKELDKKKKAQLIKEFSKKILEKHGPHIKCIIAWGSLVRGEFHSKSDIDLVIVVDDTRGDLNEEAREEMDDFIRKTAKETDENLSPQPVWTLTEFWDMVRESSPLAYTLLRDGIPAYDTGFFMPTKRLMQMGRMPATKEAVERRMADVPRRINRVKNAKLWMVAEDLYYAMLNPIQALVMYMGKAPPDPNHAVEAGKKYLVETGLTDKKFIDYYKEVWLLRKDVEHKKITEIAGKEVDKFIKKSEEFIEEMENVLKKLELRKKASDIQKSYEVFLKASIAALKTVDKLPKDPKKLPQAFKKHLIEGGIVHPIYEDIFGRVVSLRKALKDEKLHEIPEREVMATQEYVRRFIQDIRNYFKKKGFAPQIEEEKTPELKVPEKVEKKKTGKRRVRGRGKTQKKIKTETKKTKKKSK